MTPEQIRTLAKQANGTPYVNRHYPGETAVAFGPGALLEFVRLVTDAAPKNAWFAKEVPEGMQLVPIEPTEAMHQAAVKAIVKCHGNHDFPPAVYKAMLEAAKP